MKLFILIFIFLLGFSLYSQNGIYKITNLNDNSNNLTILKINENEFELNTDKLFFNNFSPEFHINYYNSNNSFKIEFFPETILNEIDGINLTSNLLTFSKDILKSNSIYNSHFNDYIENDDLIKIQLNNNLNKNKSELLSNDIVFSSLITTGNFDQLRAITKDSKGNVYYGGESNFNMFSNISENIFNNGGLAQIIIKTNSNKIEWITLIGGSRLESVFDLTVDDNDNIWGVGETQSQNYPITSNAIRKNYSGGYADASLFNLNQKGELVYGTYYGTNNYEALLGIEYFQGKIYSVGQTGETAGFFIILDKTGNLLNEGVFESNGVDSSEDLAIDSLGNMYLTGWIEEDINANFSVNSHNGGYDSYVVRYNIISNQFDKLIYVGGSKNEQSFNIEIDKNQNIYLTGITQSSNFPLINTDTKYNGNQDVFVVKISPDFEIIWTNIIGGSNIEGIKSNDSNQGGICITDDLVFISSQSKSKDLDVEVNYSKNSTNDDYDVFFKVFNSNNGSELYSVRFGGSDDDYARAILLKDNLIHIVGLTKSKDFITTADAYAKSSFGDWEDWDGFLTILSFQAKDPDPDPTPDSIYCDNSLNNYPSFAELKRIDLIGDVFKFDSTLILTNNIENQTGGVWSDMPYDVRGGFTSEFVFQISEGDDLGYSDGFNPGADGIAFVLQADNKGVLGKNAGGIGYEGIVNALAIEIDLYWNDQPEYNDPNGNHLAIFSSKEEITADHHSNDLIYQFDGLEPIDIDDTKYKMLIEYDAENLMLDVYLSKFDEEYKLVANVPGFDINSHLNLISNRGAFIGITSSTGNSVQIHKLNSWYFCTGGEVPLPESIGEIISFPNPAVDYLNIKSDEIYEEISISDLMGTRYSFDPNSTKLDISKFNTGIYILELKVDGKMKVQKFIVE